MRVYIPGRDMRLQRQQIRVLAAAVLLLSLCLPLLAVPWLAHSSNSHPAVVALLTWLFLVDCVVLLSAQPWLTLEHDVRVPPVPFLSAAPGRAPPFQPFL